MRYAAFILLAGTLSANEPVLKREPGATTRQQEKPADVKLELVAPPPVVLNKSVMEALQVSTRWREGPSSPAPGADGSVVYTYGQGLPTVVCAPMHVCFLELQPGEKIVGPPMIGDSLRWEMVAGGYGGPDGTQVVMVKPRDVELDTNLLVMTDRRPYFVRLISKEKEYVARTSFRYPGEELKRWQQAQPPPPPPEAKVLPAIIATERINFGYRISGGDEHLRPRRVYDDGEKTFIQMPPSMEHRAAPALLVMGADGKGVMTNYRVHERTYIIDALFDKAQLRLGTKKEKFVTIERDDRG